MKRKLFLAVMFISAMMISCGGNKNQETTDETTQAVEVNEGQNANDVSEAFSVEVVSTPIHLTTDEFKKLVVNYEANPNKWIYLGDKPAIVDFWATWCPPCKTIAPILDDLAKEYQGQIYVYKVDVDKETELASAFGIQSIPTLLFIPMKGEPKAEIGAISKDTFKDRIDNFLLVKE